MSETSQLAFSLTNNPSPYVGPSLELYPEIHDTGVDGKSFIIPSYEMEFGEAMPSK
jgi:hypothetical protein